MGEADRIMTTRRMYVLVPDTATPDQIRATADQLAFACGLRVVSDPVAIGPSWPYMGPVGQTWAFDGTSA